MKLNKTYTALFIGLAAGFALGVLISEHFLTKISIIPGWETTVSPNAISIQALLFGLALMATGMSLARIISFFKSYFTIERIEVLNIGIGICGIAIMMSMIWNLFQA